MSLNQFAQQFDSTHHTTISIDSMNSKVSLFLHVGAHLRLQMFLLLHSIQSVKVMQQRSWWLLVPWTQRRLEWMSLRQLWQLGLLPASGSLGSSLELSNCCPFLWAAGRGQASLRCGVGSIGRRSGGQFSREKECLGGQRKLRFYAWADLGSRCPWVGWVGGHDGRVTMGGGWDMSPSIT